MYLFRYTFEEEQKILNADLRWKFQRYRLMKEYFNRPPFAPPFNIVWCIICIIKLVKDKIWDIGKDGQKKPRTSK